MKYIMCSSSFPKGHPKEGAETHFPEKIMACLADKVPGWKMKNDFILYDWYAYYNCTMPKGHTIRAGNRFKPGEAISLRVWSDKPYRSKQIEFAQVEVKRVWSFNIHFVGDDLLWQIPGAGSGDFTTLSEGLATIANNDGLSIRDFIDWFTVHPKYSGNVFNGQIICWSPVINY